MRHNGMEWNGMEWNGMYNEPDKKGLYLFHLHTFTYPFHSIDTSSSSRACPHLPA